MDAGLKANFAGASTGAWCSH